MGASSGMGYGVAKMFIEDGWKVGVAARRMEKLEELKALAPDRVICRQIDVSSADSHTLLRKFIEEMGGIDYYFHASGLGLQNPELIAEKEDNTMMVNVVGFTKLIVEVFNYMKVNGGGHIGIISSVAGTKGLGVAPSYSASKRLQYSYLQSLSQLSNINHYNITFTDIRPGFVATEFLNPNKKYPLMISKERASKIIYKALLNKKRVKTFDWKFRLIVTFWRSIPNYIWERMKVQN